MRRRPTIIDVAKLAGVSTATVSNVLDGDAWVASGTRAKVEDAVDQLGFVPNVLARTLIQARRPLPEPKRSRLAPR